MSRGKGGIRTPTPSPLPFPAASIPLDYHAHKTSRHAGKTAAVDGKGLVAEGHMLKVERGKRLRLELAGEVPARRHGNAPGVSLSVGQAPAALLTGSISSQSGPLEHDVVQSVGSGVSHQQAQQFTLGPHLVAQANDGAGELL